eukprot:jgi/Chlat1/2105/Chrsp17S02703
MGPVVQQVTLTWAAAAAAGAGGGASSSSAQRRRQHAAAAGVSCGKHQCCTSSSFALQGSSFLGSPLPQRVAGHASNGCSAATMTTTTTTLKATARVASTAMAASHASAERTVRVPVNYYEVLGAHSLMLPDAIWRQCDQKLEAVPEQGLSEDALAARAELLRTARDSLCNPTTRKAYDTALAMDHASTLLVESQWSKLPGVLCLLQEAGEHEVVLQSGAACLRDSTSKSFRHDVALVMALSYCDLSAEALASTPPSVTRGCELLEQALQLLISEGGKSLAPTLQAEIAATLHDLAPDCVLESLALPLDLDHEAQRQSGMRDLQTLVYSGDTGRGARLKDREGFMKQAFVHMTAAEQVALFADAPENVPAESFEVYAAALAHLAQGFSTHRPQLIQDADTLFAQLQRLRGFKLDSSSRMGSGDLRLERGICAILLGFVEEACTWLNDGSSPPNAVWQFVLANSPIEERDAPLSGLCKLTERWLREVLYMQFRDLAGQRPSISEYFDNTQVQTYLEGLERPSTSTSSKSASSSLSNLAQKAATSFSSLTESAKQAFQSIFPPVMSESSETASIRAEGEDVSRAARNATAGAAATDIAAIPPSITSEPASWAVPSVAPVEMPITKRVEVSTGNKEPAHEPEQDVLHAWNNLTPRQPPRPDEVELLPLPEQRDPLMQAAILIAAGAVFAGAITFFARNPSILKSGRGSLPTAATAATTSSIQMESIENVLSPSLNMDKHLAEKIVHRWQTVKAQALGGAHDVAALKNILAGQMLDQWTLRANDVARNGWFWQYKLVGLEVDKFVLNDTGKEAIVESTLQEAAQLYDKSKPEANDSYRSTYTARYVLQWSPIGWRIVSGQVVR